MATNLELTGRTPVFFVAASRRPGRAGRAPGEKSHPPRPSVPSSAWPTDEVVPVIHRRPACRVSAAREYRIRWTRPNQAGMAHRRRCAKNEWPEVEHSHYQR